MLSALTAIPTEPPALPELALLTEPLFKSQNAIAHQVEIAEDVGATLHIKPNDTPRAGEEVLAWFALTKKGGQTIPLSDCDCQIEVYSRSEKLASSPSDQGTLIAAPTPEPISSEGYQNIPGASFTFPTVGAYTLVISGSPKKAEDSFQPFTLAFDVTVAAGASVAETSANSQITAEQAPAATEKSSLELNNSKATPTVEDSSGETGKLIGIGVIGAAIIGASLLVRGFASALKRKKRS